MTPQQGALLKKFDIVQVKPEAENWTSCLVVVTDVFDWGIMGYTSMPPKGGMAYIRIKWADLEGYCGTVLCVPATEVEDGPTD